jgi:uncharacterized membrane protein YvbJ
MQNPIEPTGIIDHTPKPEVKGDSQEKCPFCGVPVQPTAPKCGKCGKNLRDKKANKQRSINDGTYKNKLTFVVAIITGSIFLIFVVFAIIGFFI